GGDEFIIVGMGATPGAEGDDAADALRERVEPLIRGAYRLGGCALDYPGASVGVVSADPGTTTPDHALRAADAAMYVQKKIRRAARA
ncbi:diguanylate cyclase, partial [Azospirillum brasilense]|nr:diguanylate cyclase [Azospirillum argentinense]